MAVQFLQPPTGGNAVNSLAYGSKVTKGSLLILACGGLTVGTTVSDSLGNGWLLATSSGAGPYAGVFYAVNVASGPNLVNYDAGGSNDMWLVEVTSGMSRPPMGVTPFLHKVTSASGSSTTPAPGALTPSFLDVFLISCMDAFLHTVTGGTAGWQERDFGADVAMQTRIPTVIASQNGAFTINTSGNWAAAQACFAFTNTDVAASVLPRPKPFLV